MGRWHLLLIGGDDLLRRSLLEQLSVQEEFAQVEGICTGQEGVSRAVQAASPCDAILLDHTVSDVGGLDVCRRLRDHGIGAPVILLTASNSDKDTLAGLEAGANECLPKPFRLAVLLARLKAQIQQHDLSDGNGIFMIGPYRFVSGANMLRDALTDRMIRLTEKETAILTYLCQTDTVVNRETLLGDVWGYRTGVSTHTLETHVYQLRQKIEPDPGNAIFLVTDVGGYRLNGKKVFMGRNSARSHPNIGKPLSPS